MIDLDPQASAANWSDRRKAEQPVVLSAHARRLPHEIRRVRETVGEMLYIDTVPHSDSAAPAAARATDLVLIPCRPAIINTLAFLRTTGKPVLVVLNAIAATGQDVRQAEEALSAHQVETCPIRLGCCMAFSRTLVSGQAAQEFEPDGKAARVIAELHTFVLARLKDFKTSTRDRHSFLQAAHGHLRGDLALVSFLSDHPQFRSDSPPLFSARLFIYLADFFLPAGCVVLLDLFEFLSRFPMAFSCLNNQLVSGRVHVGAGMTVNY